MFLFTVGVPGVRAHPKLGEDEVVLEGEAALSGSAEFDDGFFMNQWEFQDPKMEVLYHIRPYFVGICGDILLHRPYRGLIYGRYLQFRFLKWPLNECLMVIKL